MESNSIRWDHCLTTLRCLRAALDVFQPGFPQSDLQSQVIRGVWGFVPYATEFWCVDLRDMVSIPVESWDPRFANIIAELSAFLSTTRTGVDGPPLSGQPIEELEPIRCLASLWYDATLSLQARSLGRRGVTGPNQSSK